MSTTDRQGVTEPALAAAGTTLMGRLPPSVNLLTGALVTLIACTARPTPMDTPTLRDFATRYTAAWCSQNAASVASFFSQNGSLTINDGAAAVGRSEITTAAQGFMSDFPDMVVTMDEVDLQGGQAIYRWTLSGTNTGPGGTGQRVRIRGYEEWTIGKDGLIAASKGHFDAAEYQRQLKAGAPATP